MNKQLTPLAIQRFIMLADFLDNLPDKEFLFSKVAEFKSPWMHEVEGPECQTTGCAIGWTPRVFPEVSIDWEWAKYCGKFIQSNSTQLRFRMGGLREMEYDVLAARLFDIHAEEAIDIFCPWSVDRHVRGVTLPPIGVLATPREVANRLRRLTQVNFEPDEYPVNFRQS